MAKTKTNQEKRIDELKKEKNELKKQAKLLEKQYNDVLQRSIDLINHRNNLAIKLEKLKKKEEERSDKEWERATRHKRRVVLLEMTLADTKTILEKGILKGKELEGVVVQVHDTISKVVPKIDPETLSEEEEEGQLKEFLEENRPGSDPDMETEDPGQLEAYLDANTQDSDSDIE